MNAALLLDCIRCWKTSCVISYNYQPKRWNALYLQHITWDEACVYGEKGTQRSTAFINDKNKQFFSVVLVHFSGSFFSSENVSSIQQFVLGESQLSLMRRGVWSISLNQFSFHFILFIYIDSTKKTWSQSKLENMYCT